MAINISLPDPVVSECVDAGIIQMKGSMGSVEARCQQAQRLTYNVGEYVVAKVQAIFNSTKRLK